MRPTHWQDVVTKVIPLVVSVITAYFSYSLSKTKSDRESAREQFDRLNDEAEKMRRERDQYYEQIKKQDQQILKLKKELLLRDSAKQQREAEHDK